MLALVGVGFVGGRLGVFLQSGTQMSLETEPVGWTFLVNAAAATALVALILARAPRPPTSPRS